MGIKWPRGRTKEAPVGVVGTARLGGRSGGEVSPELLRRLGRGDVAVIDQVDLDRATAHALVDAGVAGVVNASPSISGRYPNLGPEILTEAGVALLDDVGDAVLRRLRDGASVRLHDGGVYLGDEEIARGFSQTPETVADQLAEARSGLAAQLEAFSANTTEFMGRERAMLLDGVGVPGLETAMNGRAVLVVAPGPDRAAELRRLRHFVREERPVLVGVGGGADALKAAGWTPSVVVGTALEIDPELARKAVDVVIPADLDGHIAGLARLQDAGIDPVGFPSSANPEDMALILAQRHGASLVVACGFDATLSGFLDRGRTGSNPSTVLTRLRLGPTLVDASAVAALHRHRVTTGAVLLLLLAVMAVGATALLASGVAEALVLLVREGWTAAVAAAQGVRG
ncbi:putative cytokinetic ring protein SteA [Actinomycetospora lemnae]|uniref:Cytokinetic ring protein SteA n=1 Tax=Actinomycetospora lemnae TaxID=3019891 RepID=A0ABT5T2Q2_9PSEU|nr:putative cytokinetic ring protein SteA [Actinomycetospora sp. DW7H6]MDD7969404.1 putative cytokinetic ring protein SteA [Actinomycetospora sp. DW7H6]